MDDEWNALEHYLLNRTSGSPERPRFGPADPAPLLVPTSEPEEVSPPEVAALGVRPAPG
jgi:hypothetical protein